MFFFCLSTLCYNSNYVSPLLNTNPNTLKHLHKIGSMKCFQSTTTHRTHIVYALHSKPKCFCGLWKAAESSCICSIQLRYDDAFWCDLSTTHFWRCDFWDLLKTLLIPVLPSYMHTAAASIYRLGAHTRTARIECKRSKFCEFLICWFSHPNYYI